MPNITKDLVRIANRVVKQEALILTGDIQEKFYSGKSANSLGTRSGQARRGWTVITNSEGNVTSIVNAVTYADQSKEKVIKPKNSKYLAIPVGPALTPAGVARFSGPRDSNAPKMRVAGSAIKDNLVLLGVKKGNKKKEHIFFSI